MLEQKLKLLGQAHDDVLLTTDGRFRNYKAKDDRNILNNGLLFRENYGETGSVKDYQIVIPKQLVSEVLRSLLGEIGKFPGNSKAIFAYRGNYNIRLWRN